MGVISASTITGMMPGQIISTTSSWNTISGAFTANSVTAYILVGRSPHSIEKLLGKGLTFGNADAPIYHEPLFSLLARVLLKRQGL
jgi:hypothetical protein